MHAHAVGARAGLFSHGSVHGSSGHAHAQLLHAAAGSRPGSRHVLCTRRGAFRTAARGACGGGCNARLSSPTGCTQHAARACRQALRLGGCPPSAASGRWTVWHAAFLPFGLEYRRFPCIGDFPLRVDSGLWPASLCSRASEVRRGSRQTHRRAAAEQHPPLKPVVCLLRVDGRPCGADPDNGGSRLEVVVLHPNPPESVVLALGSLGPTHVVGAGAGVGTGTGGAHQRGTCFLGSPCQERPGSIFGRLPCAGRPASNAVGPLKGGGG